MQSSSALIKQVMWPEIFITFTKIHVVRLLRCVTQHWKDTASHEWKEWAANCCCRYSFHILDFKIFCGSCL